MPRALRWSLSSNPSTSPSPSPSARARVGLGRSLQVARLCPSVTVAAVLAIALRARDISEVDQSVADVHLSAFANKFASELSTGSRRLVDLACICAQRPKVVLL